MGDRVGVRRVTGEIDTGVHRLQLHLDADLLERLLHDGLGFLAHRVHRGLIDDLHAPALFGPEAIAATLPPGLVKPLRSLLEAELPARIRRPEACRAIDKVTRRLTGGAIELLGDDAPI